MAKSKNKNKSNNTETPAPTQAPTPQPTFNNSDPTNSSNEDYVTMVYNFIIGFIQNFIHLLIVIIMGIIILWGCKVSQASLLPTDIFCYPYEEKEYKGAKFMPNNDSDNFDININLKKIEDILMSEKIRFPYKDFEPNQQNMFVELLTSIKYAYWNKGTIEYIISIIESLIVTNYSIQNTFYLTLNKYLNEPLIVFLAPYFMPPYLMVVGIYNYIYLIYLWFSNMGWLFTKNTTKEKHGRPIWKVMSWKQDGIIQMCISLILVCVFLWVFLLGNFILFPGMIFFVMMYCFFSVVMYNAKIKRMVQNEKGETVEKTITYGIIEAVKDFLKYKKHYIIAIITYQLLLGVGSNFGYSSFALCVIGVVLLYFYSDLYKAIVPEYLSEAVDNYNFSSKKTCPDNSEFFKKENDAMKPDDTGPDGSSGDSNADGSSGDNNDTSGEGTQKETTESGPSYKGKIPNDESEDSLPHVDNDEDNDNEQESSESSTTTGGYKFINNVKTIQQQGGKKLVKTIKDLTRFLGRENMNKSFSNKKSRY